MYTENDIDVYLRLRSETYSQGCEGQAYGILRAAEPYLTAQGFGYKHSLIRVVFRPLYYLGEEGADAPAAYIRSFEASKPGSFKNAESYCEFFESSRELTAKVIGELRLCCKYYDVRYSKQLNAVVLGEKVFRSIDELWAVFLDDFLTLGITEDEIRRIFEEESEDSFADAFAEIK